MGMPRLELRDVSCVFAGTVAVDGVSLALAEGEVTCLLGPSGCGKSTTLRIAAGVERQSSGCVHVDGTCISNDGCHMPPERRAVGLMFQDFALFPHLTVGQNVAYGLRGSRRAGRGRAEALLARVDLAGAADKFPHQLSGGEQQRVALARAIAPRPRIMLMDEPFSGLDTRLRDEVREATLAILREEGTAVLMVTHEPEEAMRMADRIALMRGGRVVQAGAPYNIWTRPVDRRAAAFFSDINVIPGISRGAMTDTAFGPVLTPGFRDGERVEIVIRPQHLRLDFDRGGKGPAPSADGTAARGTVASARFVGHQSLVDLAMDQDGLALRAAVPAVFLPKPGTPLWLTMPRDRCLVFRAEGV